MKEQWPDVPEQYKKFTDTMTLALADAGDAIWSIVGELGCDKFECDGEKVTVGIRRTDSNHKDFQKWFKEETKNETFEGIDMLKAKAWAWSGWCAK